MNHFEQLQSYVPLDLGDFSNWLVALGVVCFFVIIRYLAITGLFWILFYVAKPAWTQRRRIYDQLPDRRSQMAEIKWSLWTSLVFGVSGVILGWLWQRGRTQIYLKFDQFGYWYLPVSFVMFALVHDLYFYLTHRILHWKPLFTRVHWVHHLSRKPSPWASFAFHPIESVVQALPVPLLAMVIPIHPVVLLTYLTFMTVTAITNHLGFEVLPAGSARNIFGRWLVSGVHHSIHHARYDQNMGLFFTWWDHVFATESPTYPDAFDRVVR